ncbi:Alg9-like mannosyltransferase family-domain-containing protein [Obelidium mucronatum]|nr:Alg9-like mannosyltransferase family-domain-containing protein [Obelidium mucronatum]
MNYIFLLLFTARLLSAWFYTVIADCDEVFNYWEPSHFLQFGTGFETWEYSPEFNIRSWFYAAIHSLLSTALARALVPTLSKLSLFYGVRSAFALVSSLVETRLVLETRRICGDRVSNWLLVFLVFGSGMTAASTAYLPSSFSMYLATLAFSYTLQPIPSNSNTWMFVYIIAASVIVGWPFSGAVAIPFLLETLVFPSSTREKLSRIEVSTQMSRFKSALNAGITALVTLLLPTIISDRVFYGLWSIVPLNIVLYNVFSGKEEGKGPDIFGTEPWYFYLLNGILNFNIVFLAALISIPCVFLKHITAPKTVYHSGLSLGQSFSRLAPFLLWLCIFSAQPHKEERFLFVVYPMLCFNAAIALDSSSSVLTSLIHYCISSTGSKPSKKSKVAPQKKQPFIVSIIQRCFVFAFVALSLSRTLAMYTNYNAPIKIYTHVSTLPASRPDAATGVPSTETLCLGKEWYRFPSHYFMPPHDGIQVRFIKSEFRGLLPAHFGDGQVKVSLEGPKRWEITRQIPPNLNEFNQEDTSRYVSLESCTFLVDSDFGGDDDRNNAGNDESKLNETGYEKRFLLDTATWEQVMCEPFLDAGRSRGLIGRVFWVPQIVLNRLGGDGRVWGKYCLLKRRV